MGQKFAEDLRKLLLHSHPLALVFLVGSLERPEPPAGAVGIEQIDKELGEFSGYITPTPTSADTFGRPATYSVTDASDPDVRPTSHGPEVTGSRITADGLQQSIHLAKGIHAGPQNPDLAFINPLTEQGNLHLFGHKDWHVIAGKVGPASRHPDLHLEPLFLQPLVFLGRTPAMRQRRRPERAILEVTPQHV